MGEKHYKIGYTQGVFDLFHIGHLNLLTRARARCDYLIVGVNGDALVEGYKHKRPVISEEHRLAIVSALRCVDEARIVHTLDKEAALAEAPFDAIFIGDDWKGSPRWTETEKVLSKHGVDVVYLSYTKDISSTILREQEGEAVRD
ncbi:MAG: adenylyltransferase/cytidyltransferase family protein [Clostridia bacterium]|nr:adenylyltransferase/cytidyltransferase family protein [Clostridia bacterium]